MANYAKKKKVLKFEKMSADQVLQHLFLDFILYLRGERFPVVNGNEVSFDVELNDDGSFKPTEESVAKMFQFLDGVWRRFVNKRFSDGDTRRKVEGMFKYSVSEEWKASKKPILTGTESLS